MKLGVGVGGLIGRFVNKGTLAEVIDVRMRQKKHAVKQTKSYNFFQMIFVYIYLFIFTYLF